MKIDIVISWVGDTNSKSYSTIEERERNSNNGELYYSLKSIKKFASWVNKIYILVNRIDIPDWIPEPKKTFFIDRKDFLGGNEVNNSLVVESIAHRINGLSENFILADDDIILGRNTQLHDFFDIKTGNPIIYNKKCLYGPFIGLEEHPIYLNQTVFKGNCPLSMGTTPHIWSPMKKSVFMEIENLYSDWFDFMRSHINDRFSSTGNYDETTSVEEDCRAIYVWYSMKKGLCLDYSNLYNKDLSYSFIFKQISGLCVDVEYNISCREKIKNFFKIYKKTNNYPMFINFNTVESSRIIHEISNKILNT
jgi:hypothetical protein